MSANAKNPPIFDPDVEDDYSSWKADIGIWKLLTDVGDKKTGPLVYLALKGKAREVVRSLKQEEIGGNTGYDKIIEQLDNVYLKDETSRMFCALKNFYDFRREGGMDFSAFIIEYERLYHKLKVTKIGELPTELQAFFLLKAANMTPDSEKLARATAKLEYKDMRDKIMKIFGDPGVLDADDMVPQVKEEVNYGHGFDNRHRGRGPARGTGRGNFRSDRAEAPGNSGGSGSFRGQMKCYACDSPDHFVRQCPHKQNIRRRTYEQQMNVHITLLNSRPGEKQHSLLGESFGKAVLDSGCSKTVAGRVWMDEFVRVLPDALRYKVHEKKGSSVFRFGDGKETSSLVLKTIPVVVGSKNVFLDVDIVDNDIPLLLSKGAMKELGMKIDFKRDVVVLEDEEEVDLHCTTTGHYCMPLNNFCIDSKYVNFVFHLQTLQQLNPREKKQKAAKLHIQFSHATEEKLLKLLRDSGCEDKEFLQSVKECCRSCQICQKFRRAPLKPIVCFPLSDRFNEVVSMDLKEFEHNKIWILHLIDTATRYTVACLIKSKKKEVVVSKIFQVWIAYFGAPRKFMFDNGGEFGNCVMNEMNEKLGIETVTTAAEAPFSNGVVERHNAILYEAMMKTLQDAKCDPEMALAWAVSAKNALQNKGGYSPNQLVFGFNTNLPSLISDLPPALSSTTSSEIIRRNLEAIHSARENYIRAETSERVRRALRHKTRPYSSEEYHNGEKVFYKRQNTKGWRGPAKVIGQEGKIVLVRHGTAYYRCHPCHLMKAIAADNQSSSTIPQVSVGKKTITKKSGEGVIDDDDDDDGNRIVGDGNVTNNGDGIIPVDDVTIADDAADDVRIDDGAADDVTINDVPVDDVTIDDDAADDVTLDDVPADGVTIDNDFGLNAVGDNVDIDTNNDNTELMERPVANTFIEYKGYDGIPRRATVLSKQPKKGGKWEDWLNIHCEGAQGPSSLNWKDVVSWRAMQPVEKEIFLSAVEEMSQDVVDAKERERQNLLENDVFETVEDIGQVRVSCKWVFTKKKKDGKEMVKARLVARGFEEDILNVRTDSPTCSRQSLRFSFVTAATMNWDLHSLDITSAFLQGNEIEREVYLQPPVELQEAGLIWKLKRCIYGLKDAPRSWYDKVEKEMIELGGKSSKYDDAMFLWHENDKLIGMIVCHVDDFVYSGTDEWHGRVIDKIKKTFRISVENQGSFKYVGLNVTQTDDATLLEQDTYIKRLEPVMMTADRLQDKESPLTKEEKAQLRSLSGQILWASSQTRPDIMFDSCITSNYGKNPTIRNIIQANKTVKKLKSTYVQLVFPNLGDPRKTEVITYADAAHANLPSGASQGGILVFLKGNGRVAPMLWQSKKISRVTKSPFASETLVQAESADSGVLIAKMSEEIFRVPSVPVVCYTDSKSLIDHIGTSHVIQDSRLRVDIARIKEMIKIKEISMKWVPHKKQLADPMTKAGASSMKLLEVLQSGRLKE